METTEIMEPIEPMEPKTYTLKINGNTLAETFTMNGTNYVSETQVDTTNWPPMFSFEAIDNDGNTTEQYDHAKLIQQVSYAWDGGKYYLAFTPVSRYEIDRATQQSEIEYLAMMMDIDLDA